MKVGKRLRALAVAALLPLALVNPFVAYATDGVDEAEATPVVKAEAKDVERPAPVEEKEVVQKEKEAPVASEAAPAPEPKEASPEPKETEPPASPEPEPQAPEEEKATGTDPPATEPKEEVPSEPVQEADPEASAEPVQEVAAAPEVLASRDPVRHEGAIKGVTVVRSDSAGNPVTGDFKVGDRIRLDATWSVPDSAQGGDTFGMVLPSEFARYTQSFALPDANGNIVGNCSVSSAAAPVLTCTLTDYVNDKTDVAGTLWFLATLDGSTEEEGVSFNVDGKMIFVPIDGGIKPSNPGTGNPPPPYVPGNPAKGSSQNQNGTINWNISFPGNRVGDGDVVITDVPTPQGADMQAHHNVDGILTVQHRAPGLQPNGNATSWQTLSGWTGGWNGDGTSFTITIPANLINESYGYRISYTTVPNETAYTGDKFSNTANVSGIKLTRTQSWTVTGGGTGSGADLGTVNVTKLGDDLPKGAVFTVEYTDGTRTEQLTLTAGETAYTVRFPRGTVLTFREINLPEINGIMWGEPVWSAKEVTVKAGESIAITLTNSFTKLVPSIDIEKWDLDPVTGDRDDAEDAAQLDPKRPHEISFTATNPGNEPLVDVQVSDRLVDGKGEISDLSCVFPDGSTGVSWDGPFDVGDYFDCFGTLPALGWDAFHSDMAVITGKGQFSGKVVKDKDPWHGQTPERPTPGIDIEKYDVDGNDADSPDEAVELPDGTVRLVEVITNTENEPLVNLVVTDTVVQGGVLEDYSCTFPDGSTGTEWAGPFAVGDSFECTALLTGVKPGELHKNIATVEAYGQFTGDKVTDEDPYHGFRDPNPTPTPTPTPEPPAPPSDSELPVTGSSDQIILIGSVSALLVAIGAGVVVLARRRLIAADESAE